MVSRIDPKRAARGRPAPGPDPEITAAILSSSKFLARRLLKDMEDISRSGEARTAAFVGGEVPRLVQLALADALGQWTGRLEAAEAAVGSLRAELADARHTAAASVAALADVLRSLPPPVVNNHVPVPTFTVEQPNINIHNDVPQAAAPVVEVHNNVPQAAPPTINVGPAPVAVRVDAPPPAEVTVNVPPRRRVTKHIEYDAEGRPTTITEGEE